MYMIAWYSRVSRKDSLQQIFLWSCFLYKKNFSFLAELAAVTFSPSKGFHVDADLYKRSVEEIVL